MELKHFFELTCHDLFFVIVVTFGIFGIATEIKLCTCTCTNQCVIKKTGNSTNQSVTYQEYFVEETETVVIIGDQRTAKT